MNNDRATNQSPDGRKSQSELQNRYGRIAISAVAAALPYGGESQAAATARPRSGIAPRLKRRD